MLENKKLKKKNIYALVISFIAIFDLFFLYFLKYYNQKLQLSNFSIYEIGNILNLVFTIALLIGLLLYLIQTANNNNHKVFLSFAVVMTVALILAGLIIVIKLPVPQIFIYDQPRSEIIKAAFFSVYQFLEFILLSMVWYSIFGRTQLLILRSAIIAILIVAVLFIFSYYYLSRQIGDREQITTVKDLSNVAVVLGAAVWSGNKPSPSLAARSDKAAELYKEGFVGKIQLTGSNAPGELSESEVALNYLMQKNVNSADIWIESKTTSTSEQIHFIKYDLLNRKDIAKIIITSDSYHLTRVAEICKFFNVDADFAASDLKLSFQNRLNLNLKESIALIVFWFFAV